MTCSSICSLCESNFSSFFDFPFAIKLWCWLNLVLQTPIHFSSLEDLWLIGDMNKSKHETLIFNSTCIYLINAIWLARNSDRFKNIRLSMDFITAQIRSQISITDKRLILSSSNSIYEFVVRTSIDISSNSISLFGFVSLYPGLHLFLTSF